MDQIKNRDINLMTIYLIFHQHLNFLATHVDARSWNADFSAIFGRKQPMRRDLANLILKAKIEIKQIGGFQKSFSEHGRVWAWNVCFLKLISNMNSKISISKIFDFFFLNHTVHYTRACRGGEREEEMIMKFQHFWPQKAIKILIWIK